MSATLIPTKTAGGRPPILPPVTTTFDGMPGDRGEDALAWLRDDVRRSIRHADAASGEAIEFTLSSLRQRRKWVNQDLDSSRLFADYLLPTVEGFSIDYLVESVDRTESTLLYLLHQLDDAIARSERRLARHRFEVRLLEELDTSDS